MFENTVYNDNVQNNQKALNYQNSEDLWKIMEQYSDLINDLRNLQFDKQPQIPIYEDKNKYDTENIKENENTTLFFVLIIIHFIKNQFFVDCHFMKIL